jgi:hypothetical protein
LKRSLLFVKIVETKIQDLTKIKMLDCTVVILQPF